MSTRIRLIAKTAVNATAMTATRMERGRRRAARISHIGSTNSSRNVQQRQKRRESALRRGLGQHRAPDINTRELILHFGLSEQTLCIRDFDDAREARLVAGARL